MTRQLKRLCFVLATILRLICFCASSTSTSSKTAVAGSCALQHALGVGQSDVRVNRRLRSNAKMTDNGDRNNEDRGRWPEFPIGEFPAEKMKLLKEPKVLFENADFIEWMHLSDTTKRNFINGMSVRLNKLLYMYDEETILNIISAGKSNAKFKDKAEMWEILLMRRWLLAGRTDDVYGVLSKDKNVIEFLESPFWTAWIYSNMGLKRLFELVCSMLVPKFGERTVALAFGLAKEKSNAQKLAFGLEEYLLNTWLEAHHDGKYVFTLLELNIAKVEMPLWRTWASYLFKLEGIRLRELHKDELSKVAGKVSDEELINFVLAGAKMPKKKRAAKTDKNAATTSKRRRHSNNEGT